MNTLTCPLCGVEFQAGDPSACAACPLASDCRLVCCPNCGYQQPDPAGSRLARWAARWFERGDGPAPPPAACELAPFCTLADCQPNQPACIRAFHPELSSARRELLHAHGLAPGRTVTVLQQKPVTVVQIGAAELALETGLAGMIEIEPPEAS
ncbi:MAG: ferrous iron transport protein A [Chloroflexi bacterium]|nr:ferrous iron transport protein A [Chloroflexota bacterium]